MASVSSISVATSASGAEVALVRSASVAASTTAGTESLSAQSTGYHSSSCPCSEPEPPPCTCGLVHHRTDSPHFTALRWLRRHQRDDGIFDTSCDVSPGCGGAPVTDATRATALATLAFLGQGHTHRWGTFKRTVIAALDALRRSRPSAPADALVAYTWARARAESRDQRLESDLRGAIAPIAARARAGGNGAVDAWDRLASLEAGIALTELPLPPESWASGPFPARDAGLTALAIGPLDLTPCAASVRLWADRSLDPSWLLHSLPNGASAPWVANPSAWWWGSLALRGRDEATLRAWFRALEGTILPAQREGDCVCGSWDPPPGWTRVEATALCVLALEEGLAWERAMDR